MQESVDTLFVRWSASHWGALTVIISCVALVLVVSLKSSRESIRINAGKILALFLLVMWLGDSLLPFVCSGEGGWEEKLPLHFCNVMMPICAVALWFRSRWACRLAYFSIMTACIQALVTPSLVQGFPRIEYFSFFLSHGFLLIAGLFIPIVLGWRAERWDALKVLLCGDAYIACMIPINLWLGSNYGFTRVSPPGSILDYMGSPPWYFLTMQIPALLVLSLISIPVRGRKN